MLILCCHSAKILSFVNRLSTVEIDVMQCDNAIRLGHMLGTYSGRQ